MLPIKTKIMKKILFVFLFILAGISCGYSQGDKPENSIEISLEELIQNSNKYNQKYISVYGYLKFEKGGNGNRISISKEDLENNNSKKIVWFMFFIEGSTFPIVKKYDCKYATITGYYKSGQVTRGDGKLSTENGLLLDVEIKFRDEK
jgi:hypothetical protein